MKYSYAREKLVGAVCALATHPDDARYRIIAAFWECGPLTEEHFPEELRADWRWILENTRKRGPYFNRWGELEIGAIENTMIHMQKRTAAKIAARIYRVYELLKNVEDI